MIVTANRIFAICHNISVTASAFFGLCNNNKAVELHGFPPSRSGRHQLFEEKRCVDVMEESSFILFEQITQQHSQIPQLTRTFLCSIFSPVAQMAELVDALGSGPSGSNTVQVRVLFWASLLTSCNIRNYFARFWVLKHRQKH